MESNWFKGIMSESDSEADRVGSKWYESNDMAEFRAGNKALANDRRVCSR